MIGQRMAKIVAHQMVVEIPRESLVQLPVIIVKIVSRASA
jgi:hypothetical protein